jgi:hypothetical protein
MQWFASPFLRFYDLMQVKILLENFIRKSMTRHLTRIQSSFGALLSGGKLRAYLQIKHIAFFVWLSVNGELFTNSGIGAYKHKLRHKRQSMEYNMQSRQGF